MESSNSSAKKNIEEMESEISRYDREGQERRGRLDNMDNIIKELELFDLNNNVSRESEEEESEDLSMDDSSGNLNLQLPGIKFFSGHANCDYDQKSIEAKLKLFEYYEGLDFLILTELKNRVMKEYIIEKTTDREQLFRPLMKLLFTCQSKYSLQVISEILILLMNKSSRASLLDIIIASLPVGLKNIGGNAGIIFAGTNIPKNEVHDVDKSVIENNFQPVENIRYAVDVLQYSLQREKIRLKGRLHISDKTVDTLVFTLLTVSQDPQILSSNIIPSIQNCLAEILDIYRSDCEYLKKVEDIVERILLYWEDSFEGFDHTAAYMLCCDVIPLSSRGKQLKASLAYSSLHFCLPACELKILNKPTLYALSKFCREYSGAFCNLDCKNLYSVVRLIDAAIVRPVHVENDKVYVNSLLTIVYEFNSEKSHPSYKDDYYWNMKFLSLVKEVTTRWNELTESTGSSELESLY